MWLVVTEVARAWTFGKVAVLPLAASPVGVAATLRPEGARLLALGNPTLLLDLDGSTLAELGDWQAALLVDLDADGLDDLVLCGGEGAATVAWTGEIPGAPAIFDATPCETLVAHALYGAPGVASLTTSAVALWSLDGRGALVGPTDAGVAFEGTPRAASDGDKLAVGVVGAEALAEVGPRGVSSLAVGGPLADVTAGWWVALSDRPMLRDLDGADVALAGVPWRTGAADVDGDGLPELLALEPGAGVVEVFPGDGSPTVSALIPAGATSVFTLDVDGDGCTELILGGDSGVYLVPVDGCPLSPDDDGDGSTLADGDCDDGDPTRSPGAAETCDGRDEDCDGVVDEPGEAFLVLPASPSEGEEFQVWAAFDGCDPGATWAWDAVDAALAACADVHQEIHCLAVDDGPLPLHVSGAAGDERWELSAELALGNVAPSIELPAAFADGVLRLDAGDVYTASLVATDPGDDVVTFAATEGPASLSLSPSGALVVDADEIGAWDATIEARDEDGGIRSFAFRVEVRATDDTAFGDSAWDADDGEVTFSSGCSDEEEQQPSGCAPGGACSPARACCGSPAVAILALAWVGARRRARSPHP